MSGHALLACAVLYLIAAVENALMKEWAMALVFGAYAVANVGLALITK